MSNLISNRRAASRGSQTPSPRGNVTATTTPDMGTIGVPLVTHLGLTVSRTLASSTSLVTHHVLSTRRTHRRSRSSEKAQPSGEASSVHGERSQTGKRKKTRGPCKLLKMVQTTHTTTEKTTIMWDPRHHAAATKEQHSALATDVSSIIRNHCPLKWESWRAVPQEVKDDILHELSHHYELSNLDANQMQYINDLCYCRFIQWKNDLHKHYKLYDGPEVALEVGCPIKLVDHRDEWEWLCCHFQYEKYLKN